MHRKKSGHSVEKMDHFFAVNGIDKKNSTFLAVIGPATYTLVRNSVSPDKPEDKTYDELVAALKNHFNPMPLGDGPTISQLN